MKKKKKLTWEKLEHILKNNVDFITIHENEHFGKERFMIYFKIDVVIYSETFEEIKKFGNEFFIMTNDEHLILVIYK